MPIALLPALYVWEWPVAEVWAILIATGPAAVVGHITMTKAYKLADASFVAGLIMPGSHLRSFLAGLCLASYQIFGLGWVPASFLYHHYMSFGVR